MQCLVFRGGRVDQTNTRSGEPIKVIYSKELDHMILATKNVNLALVITFVVALIPIYSFYMYWKSRKSTA